MNSKYRYLAPNGVTFISLICGVIAIFSAVDGNLWLAGSMVLTSYILDLFDGMLARKLNAQSEFGLQLDSLVDMVSLGMAPAVAYFVYLKSTNIAPAWAWILGILIPIAGAFRLARFNLLPPKSSSSTDSAGLTISAGGAIIALTVLSDLASNGEFFSNMLLLLIPIFTCLLMVSTIAFPSLFGTIGGKRRGAVLLAIIGGLLTFFPFVQAWFLLTSGYVGGKSGAGGSLFSWQVILCQIWFIGGKGICFGCWRSRLKGRGDIRLRGWHIWRGREMPANPSSSSHGMA